MQKIWYGLLCGIGGFLGGVVLWKIVDIGYHGSLWKNGSSSHQVNFSSFSPRAVEKIVEQGGKIIPIAIIGSGPAGRSAALYGSRLNFHAVVFEGKKPGGQLMGTSEVENWPGINRDLGPQIMDRLKYQAAQFGALFAATSVEKIDTTQWPFAITLEEGAIVYALTIILATGSTPKKLGVPGEDQYWGQGVTTCAVCDAPFFRDKNVVVIGGGDAAVEEALQLAAYARSITMLVRGERMRASHAMQDRLRAYPQVTVQYSTQLQEILGDGKHVTGVKIVSQGVVTELAVEGVFLAIGHTPNSSLVHEVVHCDRMGYIERTTPHRQATSMPGCFVAGDVADHIYRQAGVASGDGIKAAIDAVEFLRDCHLGDADLAKFESHFYDPTTEESSYTLTEVTSLEQFEKDVLSSQQTVVIEFYTPTCPTCTQVAPVLASALQQHKDAVQGFKVDGSLLPQLMDRYEITSVPTMLVLKKGIVVGRTTPVVSQREIRSYIALFI